jgi:hypothetical protein
MIAIAIIVHPALLDVLEILGFPSGLIETTCNVIEI